MSEISNMKSVLSAVIVTALVVGGVVGGVSYFLIKEMKSGMVEYKADGAMEKNDDKKMEVEEIEDSREEVVEKTIRANAALEDENGFYVLNSGQKIEVAKIEAQFGANETINGAVENVAVPNEIIVASADSASGEMHVYIYAIKQKNLTKVASMVHRPFLAIAGMADENVVLVQEGIDFGVNDCYEGPWFIGVNMDKYYFNVFNPGVVKSYNVPEALKKANQSGLAGCEY